MLSWSLSRGQGCCRAAAPAARPPGPGTPRGLSRKDWETERAQRVGKPGQIEVGREKLDIKADGATEVECIIVQPPSVKRWVTTPGRIKHFERELEQAVQTALLPNAPVKPGDHCKWCPAKAICPALSGEAERALRTQLNSITPEGYSNALIIADRLEDWIKDVREQAQQALENNVSIPGWKLVPKRAIRQWVDEEGARESLEQMGLDISELMETSLISPAKAEKVLKKHKLALPKDHVVAISSGNTIAPESDPRPAVITIGADIRRAFSKLEVK